MYIKVNHCCFFPLANISVFVHHVITLVHHTLFPIFLFLPFVPATAALALETSFIRTVILILMSDSLNYKKKLNLRKV